MHICSTTPAPDTNSVRSSSEQEYIHNDFLIPLLTAALQNMLQNHRELLQKIDGEEIKIKFNPSEGIVRDLAQPIGVLEKPPYIEGSTASISDQDESKVIGAVPDQLEPNSESGDKWVTSDHDSNRSDEERDSELAKDAEQVTSIDAPKFQANENGKVDMKSGDKSNSDDDDEPSSNVTDKASSQENSKLEIPGDLILPDVNAEDIPRLKRAVHGRRTRSRLIRKRLF